MGNISIFVFEVVSSSFCATSNDGQKVHDRLNAALKSGQKVILSFRNISLLTPTFLNAAVGQLYASFTEEDIRNLLEIQNMQPDDLVLLQRVVETAKHYFNFQNRMSSYAVDSIGACA
jgi:STAS-like domain of unknown function (DUF4325)